MSRDQETGNAAAVDSPAVQLLALVRLDFPSGIVAAHSGIGSFSFNGDTYLGVGEHGKLSAVREDRERGGVGVTLELSGVDPDLLSDVIDDDYHGRDCDIYLLWLDSNNVALDDPDPFWSGFIDSAVVTLGENQGRIVVQGETRWTLRGPGVSRYTDEDQQGRFAGDVFFEFLDQIQDRRVLWGGTYAVGGGSSGGGGGNTPGGGGGGAVNILP